MITRVAGRVYTVSGSSQTQGKIMSETFVFVLVYLVF